jgi:DNA-binding XRE family transcriptional regulator
MLDMTFADELRKFRFSLAMTQREAAKDASVPYQSYVVAESGRVGPRNKFLLDQWMKKKRKKKR